MRVRAPNFPSRRVCAGGGKALVPRAALGPTGRDRSHVSLLAIERLCVFGMPPVQFVNLAADLGCRHISTGFVPMSYNPHGYPKWSLRDDASLRGELIAAMRDRKVSISLCEGFGVAPDSDVGRYGPDLDILCELGVDRINIASMDRDLQRTLDQFARLAEMADARGIESTIEIGPGPIARLPAALAAVRHVGRPNFRLLIDTMHFVRSGSGAADIAALDPKVIGYVQICDVPLKSRHSSYLDEALHERMVPGLGELPLLDILAALPDDVIIGVEVPQRSLAEAGVGPFERVARCVEATRGLLTAARRKR
jgi:sugar phosphate isomerase/epimerase